MQESIVPKHVLHNSFSEFNTLKIRYLLFIRETLSFNILFKMSLTKYDTIDFLSFDKTLYILKESDVLLAEQFTLEDFDGDLYKYKNLKGGEGYTYFPNKLIKLNELTDTQFVIVY
ncbi:unknown [Cryptophlebia leucotreta granulovirus]|uniref:Uncharacterized protein n=1 Tax=Cryptophlebia leucotreta granulosis virus TaxID=35254 RepID=Q7T5H0_GVCL|nr:hypothetical protein [Cryptophlebia leucotreta granulovirus]AAQ21718.1 unknown [Cryptophlebia leucotreta granulovirus]AUF82056.1 hypothetical protein [Cryptophlebia leucotreta granulovirus]